jgi:hypothetical protein
MPTGGTVERGRICSAYFSWPAMKIKLMHIGNYLQGDVVSIENRIFYRSFILKDYISLQAPCEIFANLSARFRQPISHSHNDDTHIHLIYPTYNAPLLSLIFASVRILNSIMSYDHSNFVIELNKFDRLKIRESRNVNIWICLFIPRSTTRPVSRRVAHHQEPRP